MALESKPQLTMALMVPAGQLQPGDLTPADQTPFTSFPEAAEITLLRISGHWLAHPSKGAHDPPSQTQAEGPRVPHTDLAPKGL